MPGCLEALPSVITFHKGYLNANPLSPFAAVLSPTTKLGHDPRLVDEIIPKDFNVSCHRPTPGQGYLKALAAPNTTVYSSNIGSMTPKEIHHLNRWRSKSRRDNLCGFDTSFRPRFPIIGLDGVNIRDLWRTRPLSYLSLGVPRVPSYFIYIGPYVPLGHSPRYLSSKVSPAT